MAIPLEDNFADIIGKAQRGLSISDNTVAAKTGLDVEAVLRLRAGHFNEEAARKVAPVLDLDPDALAAIGNGKYAPAEIEDFTGLDQFNTEFGDMTVNAYLAWDATSKEAAAFDTGGDCTGILESLHTLRLNLRYIFLTHIHGDHVYDLDRLRERTGAPAFVSSRETMDGAESIEAGREFPLGALKIGTRLTWGHARGGLTFVITGLDRPIAVVGDALFAGSMGGGMVSYADALRTDREEIFTLPENTIICPGHGPLTTVAEEKAHNPFFAGRV
ncbi:MAG TPA: MBL fold metallo-hydrolase [Chthoniobacteraceae bacterium]|jgi:glyoxylase-like metal-dependent hydrolase (beta-lactamase superfamily II)|nr:MBL fold metallo-hydrolase [Chthoniobacteraceae bacterium]